MTHRYFFCVVVTLVLSAQGCSTESAEKAGAYGHIAVVDSLIQQAVEREEIPGAVVRIQQEDSVLHYKAYGYAQKYAYGMKPLDDPEEMNTGHLFDLASLTKVFATTFGLMLLVDEGKVGLDEPIHTYLPKFAGNEKKEITVGHLLTHTSGLPQWYPLYYSSSDKGERYDQIAGMQLKWPVGGGRHYSDLGFMLLGDIMEKVSGRPLNNFLERELYEPLGLHHTVFNPLERGFEKIAATSHGNPFEKKMVYDDEFGYRVDVDPDSWKGWRTYTLIGEVNDGNAWYANGGVAGHAGLFSTAGDLQKMINLLMDRGSYGGRQIISEAVVDTFLTKNRYGNGLGWAMDKAVISAEGSPKGTFGHTGFTGTNVLVIPGYELSLIFLTNRQNTGPRDNGYYFNLDPLRQKLAEAAMSSSRQ